MSVASQWMERTASSILSVELWKTNKAGELLEDISDYLIDGKVTYNDDRAIKTAFDFTLRSGVLVQGFQHFVAPFITVAYDNGESERQQMGQYVFDVPELEGDTMATLADVKGQDMTWVLAMAMVRTPYTIKRGAFILREIRKLIESCGLYKHSINNPNIIGTPTMVSTTTWDPGTSKLEIINELLQAIGFYSLYMSWDGSLIGRPIVLTVDKEPVAHYTADDLLSPIKTRPVTTTLCNVVIVRKDNAGDTPLYSFRINDDPKSPTSTVSLEIEIPRYEENSNITSQAEADRLADFYIEQGNTYYNAAQITVPANLDIEPHVAIEIDLISDDGTNFSGKYNLRTMELGLDEGSFVSKLEINQIVQYVLLEDDEE